MDAKMIQQLEMGFKNLKIPYRLNEPLSKYTTFRVGGPAKMLVAPVGDRQILSTLLMINGMEHMTGTPIKHTVIGAGSNLLVNDKGYDGVVIWISHNFSKVTLGEHNCILATAGTPLAKVCTFAQQQGLTGLEFAYGIPGSVGGAIYMNAGAYGKEMKDVVVKTTHCDYDAILHNFTRQDFDFDYRHSVYMDHPEYTILSAVFRLEPGDPDDIQAKMDDYFARRKEKQPLEFPSAGSTFKRPEGHFAGALIEQCGLKGLRIGDAEVSEKHAGFIINRGHATAREIRELVLTVTEKVREQTGVELEPELLFLN